jgi:hypothetical protein
MHIRSFVSCTLTGLLIAGATSAFADRATKVENAIWANDQLFGTVLTDTSFRSPPPQSTDTLYNFSMSGLTGQRSVSEAAPGDTDFNGGRWSVKMVVFTTQGLAAHDPDGDGVANFELTNADDVLAHAALGHFDILDTGVYFECPLIP